MKIGSYPASVRLEKSFVQQLCVKILTMRTHEKHQSQIILMFETQKAHDAEENPERFCENHGASWSFGLTDDSMTSWPQIIGPVLQGVKHQGFVYPAMRFPSMVFSQALSLQCLRFLCILHFFHLISYHIISYHMILSSFPGWFLRPSLKELESPWIQTVGVPLLPLLVCSGIATCPKRHCPRHEISAGQTMKFGLKTWGRGMSRERPVPFLNCFCAVPPSCSGYPKISQGDCVVGIVMGRNADFYKVQTRND